MQTLLLDRAEWDLVLDSAGNIAVASEPYSLGQDAASAVKTFSDGGPGGVGECYFDTTLGVPYFTEIFRGPPASVSRIKQLFVDAALTVPGVSSARCFIAQVSGRMLLGQVQVTPQSGAPVQAANFTVQNPQGTG